jgi:hypothetical protein
VSGNGSEQELVMTAAAPAKEKLHEAIERLRDDIDRVEFWADALDRLTQPIPDYEATDDLSRHLLSIGRRRGDSPREH